MKRLFLISFVLFFSCLYAYGDTEVVGGGATEGTDVVFDHISATSINLSAGTPATPAIAIKNGNTGLNSEVDGILQFIANGTTWWDINYLNGDFSSRSSSGPRLSDENSTATNPTLIPNQLDITTGIGAADVAQLSLIASEVEALRNYTTYSEFYPSGTGQVTIYDNGSMVIDGAVAFTGISSIAADYTMGDIEGDSTWFIDCNAAGADRTVTLPTLADNLGRIVELRNNSGTNGCIFDGEGAEEINGQITQTISVQYEVLTILGGPSEWMIR